MAHCLFVPTSTDYGDAYIRSGWASRFLYDLARYKLIELVGYSANDLPVRYLLSVFEADRTRFPELNWRTLAVTPRPNCKKNSDSGRPDHAPLWRELAKLADFVEHPKQGRCECAQTILKYPMADTRAKSRKELGRLFRGCRDLRTVAVNKIIDPTWFKFFQDEGWRSADDCVFGVAERVSKDRRFNAGTHGHI